MHSYKEALEKMDEVKEDIQKEDDNDILDEPIDDPDEVEGPDSDVSPTEDTASEDGLLDELNQIFTPILVMQGFETDVSDKIQEAVSESSVLLEKNIITFDSASRMAQLISVCALLIAKQKNTEQYQMFAKACEIRNKMKLDIQKTEYVKAKALAQKFLVKVSTTNNSSIARKAADELLPETNH